MAPVVRPVLPASLACPKIAVGALDRRISPADRTPMKRLPTFLFGMAVGALLLYGAFNYHLVHARDGLHLIPKLSATLAGTYVDARQFGVRDWAEHAELAMAIEQAGKRDLLNAAAGDALETGLDRLLNGRGDRR